MKKRVMYCYQILSYAKSFKGIVHQEVRETAIVVTSTKSNELFSETSTKFNWKGVHI